MGQRRAQRARGFRGFKGLKRFRGCWWLLRRKSTSLKKGRGFAAGCVKGLRRFAQGATAPTALRGVDCPLGNEFYKPPAAVTSS